MDALKIEIPLKNMSYEYSWKTILESIQQMIELFSTEYQLIKEDTGKQEIIIAYLPINKQTNNDAIIQVTKLDNADFSSEIQISCFNQNGKIESYSERQTFGRYIDIFSNLLDQSLSGTLAGNVKAHANNAKANNIARQLINGVIIIVSVFGIVYGFKACTL